MINLGTKEGNNANKAKKTPVIGKAAAIVPVEDFRNRLVRLRPNTLPTATTDSWDH